jgi:hypothetical protein
MFGDSPGESVNSECFDLLRFPIKGNLRSFLAVWTSQDDETFRCFHEHLLFI